MAIIKVLAVMLVTGLASVASARQLKAHLPADVGNITDIDILNFSLNLEYLEANFYSWAAYGYGLEALNLTGGGPPAVGGKKALLSAEGQVYAEAIARDEINHVKLLRAALGKQAVPQPEIDIGPAFAAAADAAFGAKLPVSFDPYGSDILFYHGAFIFEDVGVNAYKGAAPLISDKSILGTAAGILATEAYHGGAIRALLLAQENEVVFPYATKVVDIIQAISNLRNAADNVANNTADYDQGLYEVEQQAFAYNVTDAGSLSFPAGDMGTYLQGSVQLTTSEDGKSVSGSVQGRRAVLAPGDEFSVAFSRTPVQVLAIVYLGGEGKGGFFPQGLNGLIK